MGNHIALPSSTSHANIISTISKGSVSDVLKLFDGPPDQYYTIIHDNMTPLHAAVLNKNAEVIEMLLSMEFPVLPDSDGNTPLHLAALQNDIAKVKLILAGHPHSSSTIKTLSKITTRELKNHFNAFGKRPCDLTTSDEIRSLLQPPPPKMGLYEGCKNNILEGVCRLHTNRPLIHISLTGDDSIIFSFPKDKTNPLLRVFVIEVSSHLSLSGPLTTISRFVKYDSVSDEIVDHNLLSTYTIENTSVDYIFTFSKMMYLHKPKEHNLLQHIFEGLCCVKRASRKNVDEYLLSLIPTIKSSVSEFIAPSIITKSQEKLPLPSSSSSIAKSVMYASVVNLKSVSFVDGTKKVQGSHIGRVNVRRGVMYLAVCSDGGMCEWLSETTLAIVYRNENDVLRVYRLDFSDDDVVTLTGPMAETTIMKAYPKIEHALILKNVSVDDISLAMMVVLMCSGGITLPIQNPKRKVIYDTFNLLRDMYSEGNHSKLDSAYLAAQLDKASTISLSERIEPSRIC